MALSPSDRSITNPAGANQLLPQGRSHFVPESPNANRVQDGALDLIKNSSAPFGAPSKAQPLGHQSL